VRRSAPEEGAGNEAEKRRTLEHATDSTEELTHAARALLAALPRRRALVKRVGLTLSGFAPAQGWQGHLFDERGGSASPIVNGGTSGGTGGGAADDPLSRARPDRHRALDTALDALRAKHGFGRILRGASFLLAKEHELGPDGFRLRTPSLNQ
jgi:hypothetical protein